ncbi:MAG: DNA topoisomerase [bacterium]
MKSLIIAEKPSVGRDIAKVLKCNKRGNGFLYNDKYIISWAIGHLVTLLEPDDYDPSLKKWTIETLPILPSELKLKAIPNTREQLKILYSLINQNDVTELICATDSGREGELIFRYIYKITNCNKPFKRLWISSLTDDAIKDGFANLKDGSHYDNLYYSAKCRSEADWLVGMNATRAFTSKYNILLSIGRVQTPTLAILVDRHNEIVNFKSEDYFEIEVLFEVLDEQSKSSIDDKEDKEDKEKTTYKALFINNKPKDDSIIDNQKDNQKDDTKNLSKILDKKLADKIVKDIKNKCGVVKSINDETKKQPPPFLYDLTELQRDCNKKYSFSAKKTLSIAQDLYEKRKMITYP